MHEYSSVVVEWLLPSLFWLSSFVLFWLCQTTVSYISFVVLHGFTGLKPLALSLKPCRSDLGTTAVTLMYM